MTQEEMLRALSAIQINGNVSQLCMGDGYMTVNNYRQPSKEQEQNNDGDYFDSTAFSNALRRLAQHMEQTRTIHWSHVYLYLRRNMSLDEMSASAFGSVHPRAWRAQRAESEKGRQLPTFIKRITEGQGCHRIRICFFPSRLEVLK